MKYFEFPIGHAKVYARETLAKVEEWTKPENNPYKGLISVKSKRQEISALTQRHPFFNRNRNSVGRCNRNSTNEPQLKSKGGFKPSLWF